MSGYAKANLTCFLGTVKSSRSSRVLGVAVLAGTLAACSGTAVNTTATLPTKPLPVVDLSVTPKGWVPVDDGDAQISVPADWETQYDGPDCSSGSPPGELLVNPHFTFCPNEVPPGPGTTAVLTEGLGPPVSKHEKLRIVNGFRLYSPSWSTYLVPQLDVTITVEGRLAERVLHTLTRSPRAVALAAGTGATVPSSWRTISFDGVAVRFPRSWAVNRTTYYSAGDHCGVAPPVFTTGRSGIVYLDTDQELGVVHCPFLAEAPPQRPANGVQIDVSPRALSGFGVKVSFSSRCLSVNGLRACPATVPSFSVLLLNVTVPGRSESVYVSLGLAGKGVLARTILHSLRRAL